MVIMFACVFADIDCMPGINQINCFKSELVLQYFSAQILCAKVERVQAVYYCRMFWTCSKILAITTSFQAGNSDGCSFTLIELGEKWPKSAYIASDPATKGTHLQKPQKTRLGLSRMLWNERYSPTCDAEENPTQRDPTIPAWFPEKLVNVIRREGADNPRIERNQIVQPNCAITNKPGDHHGCEQKGDATRANVLQCEEEQQNGARH